MHAQTATEPHASPNINNDPCRLKHQQNAMQAQTPTEPMQAQTATEPHAGTNVNGTHAGTRQKAKLSSTEYLLGLRLL